jgi:hypothetical protein
MRTTDPTLQDLATQVGSGDRAAFSSLFAKLSPAVLSAVGRDLPEAAQATNVLSATFCEVWWMLTRDSRCDAPPRDLPRWVAAIAERRGRERRQALDLVAMRGGSESTDQRFWTDLLVDHDRRTQFELANMLEGRDDVNPPSGSNRRWSPSPQASTR